MGKQIDKGKTKTWFKSSSQFTIIGINHHFP